MIECFEIDQFNLEVDVCTKIKLEYDVVHVKLRGV